ncbi:MAG: hypothetical protein WCS35_01510 [Sphaerochaeta sp.]
MRRSKVKTEMRFDFGQHAYASAYPNSCLRFARTPKEGNMAKDAKAEFYYYINGKPYLLTPGKDGITEETITVLRDSYQAERLNNRYEDEIQDPRFKFSKTLYERNPQAFADDPIDSISDLSQSPEAVLFKEELPPSIRDRVHEIIPLLISEQQELYWRLSEGRKLIDIAKEEGTTDNAIRSRRRKMIKRIQTLYAEKFGDA